MNTILRDSLDPEFGPEADYNATTFAFASTAGPQPLRFAGALSATSDTSQGGPHTDAGRSALARVGRRRY